MAVMMDRFELRSATGESSLNRPVLWAIGFIIIAVALITFGWVGPTDSDDLVYAGAAQQWVNHFPHVANGHHGLRLTIVLPMALLFSIFGPSEATLAAPLLLYLAAQYRWKAQRRVLGEIARLGFVHPAATKQKEPASSRKDLSIGRSQRIISH